VNSRPPAPNARTQEEDPVRSHPPAATENHAGNRAGGLRRGPCQAHERSAWLQQRSLDASRYLPLKRPTCCAASVDDEFKRSLRLELVCNAGTARFGPAKPLECPVPRTPQEWAEAYSAGPGADRERPASVRLTRLDRAPYKPIGSRSSWDSLATGSVSSVPRPHRGHRG